MMIPSDQALCRLMWVYHACIHLSVYDFRILVYVGVDRSNYKCVCVCVYVCMILCIHLFHDLINKCIDVYICRLSTRPMENRTWWRAKGPSSKNENLMQRNTHT